MLRLGVVAAFVLSATSAAARLSRAEDEPLALAVPVSETSWIVEGLLSGRPYQLAPDPFRNLLERYLEPFRNHTPEWRAFWRGAYGPTRAWVPELCWGPDGCPSEQTGQLESSPDGVPAEFPGVFALLTRPEPWSGGALRAPEPLWEPLAWGPRPELLALVKSKPCPPWKAPRPVVVASHTGEHEVLTLTDCDGALASDALERLSVLARPPNTPRPELPLPDEPQGPDGEWLPDVRLLHPRLVWAIGRIAEAFPGRALVLYSGYRRDAHSSLHRVGRALDLAVQGVTNEDLFSVCRRLRDAGCGFYPNNRFVHVDVRPYGTGKVAWVDVSQPGTPSEYVDGWPSVLAEGQAWLGGHSDSAR